MFLLTASFAQKSDIYARIFFIFLKIVLVKNINAFDRKLFCQTSKSRISETNFSFDVKEHTTCND